MNTKVVNYRFCLLTENDDEEEAVVREFLKFCTDLGVFGIGWCDRMTVWGDNAEICNYSLSCLDNWLGIHPRVIYYERDNPHPMSSDMTEEEMQRARELQEQARLFGMDVTELGRLHGVEVIKSDEDS